MKTLKVSVFMASVILLGSMAHAEQRCTGIETLKTPDGQIKILKSVPFSIVDANTLYVQGGGTEILFLIREGKSQVFSGKNQSGNIKKTVEFFAKDAVKMNTIEMGDGPIKPTSIITNLVCE